MPGALATTRRECARNASGEGARWRRIGGLRSAAIARRRLSFVEPTLRDLLRRIGLPP